MNPLSSIKKPLDVITPLQGGATYPELIPVRTNKYCSDIKVFRDLVLASTSSEALLTKIREPRGFSSGTRMTLLKLFRRCVSTACDTEATKKITKIKTSDFIKTLGHTFKPIDQLKSQWKNITEINTETLSVLLGEYDERGELGYALTKLFFTWFEEKYKDIFSIEGPRGAGRDIELSTILPSFQGTYPCDFVIRRKENQSVIAVGFARYDSSRGGSQSDDRTGGNANKVEKMKEHDRMTGNKVKLVFVSDGPGLTHNDTWNEACALDSSWDGNVIVTTLKLCNDRLTKEWLYS